MKQRLLICLGIAIGLLFLGTVLVEAQEKAAPAAPETASSEPEIQWLWGEVVSVDSAKGQFLVKYLDYESENEKEIMVGVDDKTTYENIKSLNDLTAQNTVSVDYVIASDGKNIAKNISVEKAETPQPQGGETVGEGEKPVEDQSAAAPAPQAAPEQEKPETAPAQ